VLTSRQLAPGIDPAAEKKTVLPQLMKARQEQFLSEYLSAYRQNSKIEDFR